MPANDAYHCIFFILFLNYIGKNAIDNSRKHLRHIDFQLYKPQDMPMPMPLSMPCIRGKQQDRPRAHDAVPRGPLPRQDHDQDRLPQRGRQGCRLCPVISIQLELF